MFVKMTLLDSLLDGIPREENLKVPGVDKRSATCSLFPEMSDISPQPTQRAFHGND